MSTEELRQKAAMVIDQLPDKALVKLVELLEELNLASAKGTDDDQLIEMIIKENRDVLSRLAK